MIRVIAFAVVSLAFGMAWQSSVDAAEPKSKSKLPKKGSPAAESSPATDAEEQSSARPAAPTDKKTEAKRQTETAIFAGGCFWCTEFAFEQVAGVIDVQSGYCGGSKSTANYDQVHLGTTAHAEAIRVAYDPNKVTYDELLDVFFDAHDPTQLNRQGEDEGRQYRSAIFYANDEQKTQAKAKIEELEKKRVHKRKIVTKVEPLKEFYPAEEYHQNFARKNPFQPYIQGHAVPNALRVRTKHPDLIRKGE